MLAATAAEMRRIDARARDEWGIPSLLLMENAGAAVAERALARLGDRRRAGVIRIVCGKGNNGGDGLVAGRRLHCRGARVVCHLLGDPAGVQGDAAVNLRLARNFAVPLVEGLDATADREGTTLWIDALLGTGFKGDPAGATAAAIETMRTDPAPVLAVDIPSGLHADRGVAPGPCAPAVETVTFGLPKPGLLTGEGRSLAGEITVAGISLPRELLCDEALQVGWFNAEDAAPHWAARAPGDHKGDSGRVLVVAGSPGLTGAATLCCLGALRAGAGLVTLATAAALNPILEVKLTEAMTLPLPDGGRGVLGPDAAAALLERSNEADALAVGPGLGRTEEVGELVRRLLEGRGVPMVLDADALFHLAQMGPRSLGPSCVLTPHPGELARLLRTSAAGIQSNRLEHARSAARAYGCTVVLKGPGTVVAQRDGRAVIVGAGGPALATGGSGDVLTGCIAACLARGLPAPEAAAAGAYLHGLAGDLAEEKWGAPGAIAGDVPELLSEAIRRLQCGVWPLSYREV